MDQDKLFQTTEATATPIPAGKQPTRREVWLVAAWNSDGYWSIRRETHYQEYDSQEKAEAAAKDLSTKWVQVRLVHIILE